MIHAPLLTAIVAQFSPVPPPMAQTTADCSRPIYATDMLVCDDPALKAMDDRLKSALAAASKTEVETPLIESQTAWFRRSRRCAFQTGHTACVLAAYKERLMVIEWAAAAAAAPASPTGRCLLSDKTTATIIPGPDGAALLRNGRVISVGVTPASSWQPFVTYRRSGSRADFRDMNGKSLATCRFATKKGKQ